MEIFCVPVLAILCYCIAEILKVSILRKKRQYRYIPVIVGVSGGILGCISYYISPELICNVTSPITAIAIGVGSGLSATGGNQIMKQFLKKEK